jgi:hypothetical protein
MKSFGWLALFLFVVAVAWAKTPKPLQMGIAFDDDVAFLKNHTKVIILGSKEGARVAVSPELQGRVMTSTAGGPEGLSFGWINRELLASGENNPHMNAFGGEDRIWLGPEGGQFSIFFKAGAPFDLDHWFTPPPLNEGTFDVVSQEAGNVHFKKAMHLVNYSGTVFDLDVERTVQLLDKDRVAALGISLDWAGLSAVAFESENRVTNTGLQPWAKQTGLLSIWILGMFNPSPETTIVIPFKPGPEPELGPVVNDAYFGKVPADRLIVKDGILFFKGDGRYRSKIGISPLRVKPFLGSYDAAHRVLTIVHFSVPSETADYVNSMWQVQDKPFAGDSANSYNDGPASPGAKPLGPFYELESSSPAAALKPSQSVNHIHTTLHFQGDEKRLDEISRRVLGVGLAEIKAAFSPSRR